MDPNFKRFFFLIFQIMWNRKTDSKALVSITDKFKNDDKMTMRHLK